MLGEYCNHYKLGLLYLSCFLYQALDVGEVCQLIIIKIVATYNKMFA